MAEPLLPDWVYATAKDLENLESLADGPQFKDWEADNGFIVRGPFAVDLIVDGKTESAGPHYGLRVTDEESEHFIEYGADRGKRVAIKGRLVARDGKLRARVSDEMEIVFRPLTLSDAEKVDLPKKPKTLADLVNLLDTMWGIQ